MLERDVESSARKAITKKRKGKTYKLADTGVNGAPDRLMMEPIPEHHRDIVSQYIYFVEFKKPGEKPRASQVREHERLRNLGYKVLIVDKKEK